VRIIVGFPAGSAPDIIARLMGQGLSERLGQQFVIENRPGAASNIGTEIVVKAPPDGYTLLGVTMKSLAFLARRGCVPRAVPGNAGPLGSSLTRSFGRSA
jgi:tripartite-type tricarboxylate transporter receptor subunit TctC